MKKKQKKPPCDWSFQISLQEVYGNRVSPSMRLKFSDIITGGVREPRVPLHVMEVFRYHHRRCMGTACPPPWVWFCNRFTRTMCFAPYEWCPFLRNNLLTGGVWEPCVPLHVKLKIICISIGGVGEPRVPLKLATSFLSPTWELHNILLQGHGLWPVCI